MDQKSLVRYSPWGRKASDMTSDIARTQHVRYKTVGWTVLESASPLVKYVWKALLSGRYFCTQVFIQINRICL